MILFLSPQFSKILNAKKNKDKEDKEKKLKEVELKNKKINENSQVANPNDPN